MDLRYSTAQNLTNITGPVKVHHPTSSSSSELRHCISQHKTSQNLHRKMTGSSRRHSTRSRIKPAADADDAPVTRNPRAKARPRSQGGKDESRLIRIVNLNSCKALLVFGILVSLIAVFLIFRLVNTNEEPEKPRVITPFPAPKLMDLPMFQGEHKEGLYWGTYRPTVYFGIRARYLL